MEWYHVWSPWLTTKCVARVCQHQLSFLLHCALSLAAQCIVIGPVCVCVRVCNGRAVPEPYYSERAHSVCISLSAFFHFTLLLCVSFHSDYHENVHGSLYTLLPIGHNCMCICTICSKMAAICQPVSTWWTWTQLYAQFSPSNNRWSGSWNMVCFFI